MSLIFADSAYAADSSFYVGLGPGYVTADVDDYSASDFNNVSGFTTTNSLRTRADEITDVGNSTWRIYGGYQFSDAFAVDLGYIDNIG